MNILYPGTVQFDATGRMMHPEYDMTLQQFYKAQDEIDMDFEAEKDEATEEVMEDFGEYFETIGLILISKNMLNLAMRYLSKS